MNNAVDTVAKIDDRLAKAESAGLITLNPISPKLGVKVEGINLKNKLSAKEITAVYDALIRHKVLIFKKIGLKIKTL